MGKKKNKNQRNCYYIFVDSLASPTDKFDWLAEIKFRHPKRSFFFGWFDQFKINV